MPDFLEYYLLWFQGHGVADEFLSGRLYPRVIDPRATAPRAGSPVGFRFGGALHLYRTDHAVNYPGTPGDPDRVEREITGYYHYAGDRIYFTDAAITTLTEIGAFYFNGTAFVTDGPPTVRAFWGDLASLEPTAVGGTASIHLGWETVRFFARGSFPR